MKHITLLITSIITFGILAFAGCDSLSGTQVGVSGDSSSNITGTITVPITTNIDLSGTVTGNPSTGEVSGGILVTFKTDPAAATVSAMRSAGMLQATYTDAKTRRSQTIWLLSKWKHGDASQETALELALKDGATLTRYLPK